MTNVGRESTPLNLSWRLTLKLDRLLRTDDPLNFLGFLKSRRVLLVKAFYVLSLLSSVTEISCLTTFLSQSSIVFYILT
jgi:hypothetical protein